jgi:PST family polysaccharide transporter
MQKEFRFKALAVADMVTVVVSGGIACWFAFRGFGVMSLVIQALVTQASSVALRWGMVNWRPTFRLSWKTGRRLLPFGAGLLGSSVVNYWFRNGDNLLVGRFCGAVQLGLYSRAYNLMMLPVSQVHSVLSPVLFPTLSSVQHSKAEVRRIFLFANQAIAVVAFPLMLGLAVVADDFVKVLWGDRWLGAVTIIRVLAIAGVGNSVYTTTGWIYMAMGRSDRMFWWTMVVSPAYLLCFALGLRWGALGVSIAFALAVCVIFWYPTWRLAGSLIDLSFSQAMLNLRGPFICALLMALGVLALRLALGAALPPAMRLSVSVLVGACVYIGAIQIANVPAYMLIKGRVVGKVYQTFRR